MLGGHEENVEFRNKAIALGVCRVICFSMVIIYG